MVKSDLNEACDKLRAISFHAGDVANRVSARAYRDGSLCAESVAERIADMREWLDQVEAMSKAGVFK
jgi:hypothetical protein